MLDVGTGTGFLGMVAAMHENSKQVYLVDSDPNLIQIVEEIAKENKCIQYCKAISGLSTEN